MAIPRQQPGGPRFNKKPALIAFGLATLFVVAYLYAVMQRADRTESSVDSGSIFESSQSGQTIDFIENVPDGVAGADREEPPEALPDTRQSDYEERLAAWLEERELRQLRQQGDLRDRLARQQREEYDRALKAGSKVEGIEPRESEDETEIPPYTIPAANRSPMDQSPAEIASLLAAAREASASGSGSAGQPTQSELAALVQQVMGSNNAGTERASTDAAAVQQGRDFVGRQAEPSEYELQNTVQAPRSRYELQTGSLIPGAMISAASSELPGDIVGQVTQDVYDTASGRFLLIPQGTKLFGRYDAFTALGQERLLIVWNRLIFPDGETLDIEGMQGYDNRGLAGFKDKVRTHFFRTLVNALLLSVVNASGEALIESQRDGDSSTFTLNLAQNFSDTTSGAFDEYLRNRLRIRPTIEIRAGYPFHIVVSKDIDFGGPYERGFTAYRTAQ